MNRIKTRLLRTAVVAAALAVVPATAATALSPAPTSGTSSTTTSSGTYNTGSGTAYDAGSGGPSSHADNNPNPKPGSSYTTWDCVDTYKAMRAAKQYWIDAPSGSTQEAHWWAIYQARMKEFEDNCYYT